MRLFPHRHQEALGGNNEGSAPRCAPAPSSKDRTESLAPLTCYRSVAIVAGIAAMVALVFGALGFRIFRGFRRQSATGGVDY